MLNWRNLEFSGNLGAHRDAATMRSAQFPNKISPILLNPPCPSASVRTPENSKTSQAFVRIIEPPMALIDTDKNGLGAGSHRQPGSAEVLLGSKFARATSHGAHRDAATVRASESTPPTPNLKTSHVFPHPALDPLTMLGSLIFQQHVKGFFLPFSIKPTKYFARVH